MELKLLLKKKREEKVKKTFLHSKKVKCSAEKKHLSSRELFLAEQFFAPAWMESAFPENYHKTSCINLLFSGILLMMKNEVYQDMFP